MLTTTRFALETLDASARLAAGFADSQNATRSSETGDLELQIAMVAGAWNRRYLQLWSGAA